MCGVLDVVCLAGVYFPSVKLYRKKQIQTSEEWHADAGACSQFGGQFGGLVRALRLTDDRSGKEVRETPSERGETERRRACDPRDRGGPRYFEVGDLAPEDRDNKESFLEF